MSHDVLSTGPSKEADSLGFEGSGLSPIGIPVLRGPSRSVGCGRSCGQPVTTPAILTSVNLVVKDRFTSSTWVRAEYDEDVSRSETEHLGNMSERSSALSNAIRIELIRRNRNRDRDDDPGRSHAGRTGRATDAIGLLFRSPSSCSGVLTGILEITSRVRRLPEAAN